MQIEKVRQKRLWRYAIPSAVMLWLAIFPLTMANAASIPIAAALANDHESGGGENAQEDDGFVPVSPESLPQMSGERLMKAAYGVIGMVFLLYSISLVVRESRVAKRLDQMKKQVEPLGRD